MGLEIDLDKVIYIAFLQTKFHKLFYEKVP